jgi:hypothetical protein
MYKSNVGKGGVYAHEAYEAQKTKQKLLGEYMGPTSFLYVYILLAKGTLIPKIESSDVLPLICRVRVCVCERERQ